MAQQTVSLFDKALKDYYIGPLRDQLNRLSVTHDKIKKNSTQIYGGRYARIPLIVAGSGGYGSRGDGGTLPIAQYQDIQEAQVPLKYHYARMQITDPTIEASKTDRMAFKSAMTVEMEGIKKDLTDDIGRQMYNDGTGLIATVSSASNDGSTTTVTFASALARKPLRVGMVIGIATANFAAARTIVATGSLTYATITGVTYTSDTAGTFTYASTGLGSVANTDLVHIAGSVTVGGSPTYHEMTGINGAVGGDGTYGLTTYLGLSGSTYPIWQSQIIDGSTINAGDANDETFQQACDEVEFASGDSPDCIFTTYGVRKVYASGLESDKRFMSNKLTGGWSALGFQGGSGVIPVYVDKHCTTATAYALTKKHWSLYRLTDFSWLDKDGAVLSRVSNSAAYEATMRYYAQLGCSKRNANARIHSLNES